MPSSRLRRLRAWGQPALLLAAAAVLARFGSLGAGAASAFQSPRSPLLPAAPSTGLFPTPAGLPVAALLIASLGLGAPVLVALLTWALSAGPGRTTPEGEGGGEAA